MADNDPAVGPGADLESAFLAGPIRGTSGSPPASVTQVKIFPELRGGVRSDASPGRLDLVLDLPVQLTVELGRAKTTIGALLQLAHGALLELDRLAGEPLDLLVNGCLVARGEVVVIDERFGIRLTEVLAPDERLRRLDR